MATPSKLLNILTIIDSALKGLKLIPVIGGVAGVSDAFVVILQNALLAYEAEAGQPLDLTKIPQETPVP